MVNSILSLISINNNISNISKDISDYDIVDVTQNQHEVFLNEYMQVAQQIIKQSPDDSFSAIVDDSLVILRLIELNVVFCIDLSFLQLSLIRLSGIIQLLDTKYKLEKIDGIMGMVVGFKEKMRISELFKQKIPTQNKDLIVDVFSKIPITNYVLASWYYDVFNHYGRTIKKEIKDVNRAMILYDYILGDGIKKLMMNHTKEEIERRIKVFSDVGLSFLSENIMTYYSCRTGNEKKRYFDKIKEIINNEPILEALNKYLSNCLE